MTNMAVKLDLIDKKILLEIDTDARKSYSEIGKKLNIGKNNVQYRMNRLIEQGVIRKFVIQPSLAKLGLFLGKIYLQLSGYTKEEERTLYEYLEKDKRISWIAKCEGRWDLMIGVYIPNMGQFIDIKKDFFEKFEKFITSYDVVFLGEGHTSQRSYLINKKSIISDKVTTFMGKEKAKVKDEDLRILKYIANNARFNYTDIANRFNMNVKTAQKRIKQLEKDGIIQGYVTFLDTKKIGYNFFKLCIYLKNYQNRLNTFIRYCLEQPNAIHVIESLGPWEIELEIETETLEDFYEITHNIRNDFSDIIKKTESVIISHEIKLDFFPEWMI